MASENKFSIPPSVSAQSNHKIETNAPPFLDVAEDDLDDTDWQDYLSQFADRGVRP